MTTESFEIVGTNTADGKYKLNIKITVLKSFCQDVLTFAADVKENCLELGMVCLLPANPWIPLPLSIVNHLGVLFPRIEHLYLGGLPPLGRTGAIVSLPRTNILEVGGGWADYICFVCPVLNSVHVLYALGGKQILSNVRTFMHAKELVFIGAVTGKHHVVKPVLSLETPYFSGSLKAIRLICLPVDPRLASDVALIAQWLGISGVKTFDADFEPGAEGSRLCAEFVRALFNAGKNIAIDDW
jgi:hypothetical protein